MRRIKYKKGRKVVPNIYEYTGIYKDEPVGMQLFQYNGESYEEHQSISLQTVISLCENDQHPDDIKWLNIHGMHQVELIREIGEWIGLDAANIGDILNVTRRPKLEDLDDILVFSIKSITTDATSESLKIEQISFLLKGNILISLQEKRSDFFIHIRERIRSGAGIVRKKQSGYLLYLLLDAIMENFYQTIEQTEDKIEALTSLSQLSQHRKVLEQIERIRENLNFMKRSVVPLRDALFTLKNSSSDHSELGFDSATLGYFNRLHQKSLEILDQIEYDANAAESASSLFFASQSQRMNAIMKTLTIFSVIFMPLTFIVGIYGMNFDNMPELKSENGYYFVLAVMAITAIIMVAYFKKKRWF